MPNKNKPKAAHKKGKTLALMCATALLAGGAVAGGFALTNYALDNAIWTPINQKFFEDTFGGARIYKDGKTSPERLGVFADFKAGINGARNDFDSYPIYSQMKATKDKNGDYFVSVPQHYFKIIDTEAYTEYYVSPSKIDETYNLKEAYKVASYQANATFDNKGKGTLHSAKDVYPTTNRSKLDFDKFAENAGSYLNCYDDAMDVNLLMTIEFCTDDLQTVFSGFTEANSILNQIEFDIDLQDTGKTNVIRVASEDLDAVLGAKEKATDRIIPGFTSLFIQEAESYAMSQVATVTGIKKVNYRQKAEASSSSASSASTSEETSEEAEENIVNCYEITFDRTVKFEEEQESLLAEYRRLVDDDDAEIEGNPYIQFGTFVKNGLTDGLKGSSHELKSINGVDLPEGCRPFSYRGIENWYGNVTEFLDGVQSRTVNSAVLANAGSFIDVCHEKHLMGESNAADAKTPDYEQIAKLGEGSWISPLSEKDGAIAFNVQEAKAGSLHDEIMMDIATVLGGGSDTVVRKPVCRGATFFGGESQGAFFMHGQNSFDDTYYAVGSRMGQ